MACLSQAISSRLRQRSASDLSSSTTTQTKWSTTEGLNYKKEFNASLTSYLSFQYFTDMLPPNGDHALLFPALNDNYSTWREDYINYLNSPLSQEEPSNNLTYKSSRLMHPDSEQSHTVAIPVNNLSSTSGQNTKSRGNITCSLVY